MSFSLKELIGMQTVNPAKLEEHSSIHKVGFTRSIIAPLCLSFSSQAPERLNMLASMIDFKYFFGGYNGVFNLALRLVREGYRVRLILVDRCNYEPEVWRREIRKYEGLGDFFDLVEVVCAYYRNIPLEVSGKDVFLATSWWTAHIANQARKFINGKRFLYLTQDYEPIFYPMGTLAALSKESYTFPHYALISTKALREYYRQNNIGVFREGDAAGEESSVVIENAIQRFPVDIGKMKSRKKKRFLFYARPEEHAERNMYEMGVMALSDALTAAEVDVSQWEFYGIGTVGDSKKVTLGRDAHMILLPKVSLQEYGDLLPEFDLGLSMMLSPHTGLVPLDMAAAGMYVVTNTYANKTAEYLQSISSNIIPADPTVSGIFSALQTAFRSVYDYEARMDGARVNWNQSWDDTFNSSVMTKIRTFIEECRLSTDFRYLGKSSGLKEDFPPPASPYGKKPVPGNGAAPSPDNDVYASEGRDEEKSIWDNSLNQYQKGDFKVYWELLSEVRKYQFKCMTGNEEMDYLQYTLRHIREHVGVKGLRALMLGCMESEMPPEIALLDTGFFDRIEVMDIAGGLLDKQRERVLNHRGVTCIEHIKRDFNSLELEENSYDLILSVGTIHHIENLELLFAQINKALALRGVLVLRDYVGPNRMQFTEEQISLINEILSILPERYRKNRSGIVRSRYINTPLEDILKVDPSESVRPQDTLPVMKEHLDVIRLANTGGTILHPLLGDIASNFEGDEDADAILKLLILLEKSLIQKAALSSDYVFCIARKKVAGRNGGSPNACNGTA